MPWPSWRTYSPLPSSPHESAAKLRSLLISPRRAARWLTLAIQRAFLLRLAAWEVLCFITAVLRLPPAEARPMSFPT